jgi:hypothetical protein
MQLLESKGVDVKSGKPPSMFQLAKIAADGEVRQKVSEGEWRSAVQRVDAQADWAVQ